jgi:hypothetical protein
MLSRSTINDGELFKLSDVFFVPLIVKNIALNSKSIKKGLSPSITEIKP